MTATSRESVATAWRCSASRSSSSIEGSIAPNVRAVLLPSMPYPKKLLNDHETVALDLHPHWWFFAKPVAALVASIVLGIIALTQDGDLGDALKAISIVLIVVTALWTVHRYLKWATTNFVITSDRVIYPQRHHRQERHRDPPRARQQRAVQPEHLRADHRCRRPADRVGRRGRQAAIHRHPWPGAGPEPDPRPDGGQRDPPVHPAAAARRDVDVASQLEKLEGMVERGTLSREEFDSQKRKLLG